MTLLRPHVLWLLLPAAAVYFVVLRQKGAELRAWRRHVAPHLMAHLAVGASGSGKARPIHLLGLFLLLAIVAASGPSWSSEPSPFTQDEATLVAAVDLSRSMEAKDVRPSRWERAVQKVRDLAIERAGARTGLVAYAGSAHMVLPPTRDAEILIAFLDALSPGLMPKAGKDAGAALALSEDLLRADRTAGTILFLTDGAVPRNAGRDQVLVLAMGRDLDLDAGGAYVTPVTVDDADLSRISRRVETSFQAARADGPDARRIDDGYWLVFPLLLLAFLWFRRGWVVAW